MAYVGRSAPKLYFDAFTKDTFSGNGSTTSFTLSKAPGNVNSLLVAVDNVIQEPGVAFTLSDNTLTFTGAPSSGSDNIYACFWGGTLTITETSTVKTSNAATITGNLVPTSNVAFSLGEPASAWKELWIDGNSLHLGNTSISIGKTREVEFMSTNELGQPISKTSIANVAASIDDEAVITFYSANTSGNVRFARGVAVGYANSKVPGANLEVNGNTYISGEVSVQDSSQQLYLRPNSTSDHGWIINNDAADGTLDFTRRGGQNVGPTNNVRMAVTQVGDVGIGTASPTAFGGTTLDVFDETTYSALLVRSGVRIMEIITSATHGAAGMGTRSNHDLNLLTNDTAQAKLSTAGDLTLNSGSLIFGAASEGVYLGVTSATAANLLDDYEEGTWTAALEGTTANPSSAVTVTGNYTKIGNMVYVTAAFANVDTTGASGGVRVTGFPFTASPANQMTGNVTLHTVAIFTGTAVGNISPFYQGTVVDFYGSQSNAGWTAVTHSAGAGRYLYFTGFYMT